MKTVKQLPFLLQRRGCICRKRITAIHEYVPVRAAQFCRLVLWSSVSFPRWKQMKRSLHLFLLYLLNLQRQTNETERKERYWSTIAHNNRHTFQYNTILNAHTKLRFSDNSFEDMGHLWNRKITFVLSKFHQNVG